MGHFFPHGMCAAGREIFSRINFICREFSLNCQWTNFKSLWGPNGTKTAILT